MGRVGAGDSHGQQGKQKSDQLTQHGDWYPSGEWGNNSKPIIKGDMDKNVKNIDL